jgi:tetratricopeptide (TPR) repeat protein
MILLVAARSVAAQEEEDVIFDDQTVDLYNEALQLSGNGNYKAAVTNLLKALDRTPGARRIYMSLVEPCFNTRQFAVLRERLKTAKMLFPGDDEICYYLGTVYQKENNQSMAIKEFSLAIEHEKKKGKTPDDFSMLSSYYMARGNSHLKLEQFEKAIADYDDVIRIEDTNGAAHANRGVAYFKTARPLLACKDWRRAKSLGVSSVNQYITKYCK